MKQFEAILLDLNFQSPKTKNKTWQRLRSLKQDCLSLKKLHTFQVRENPNPDFKPKQVRNPGLGRLAKFQNGKLTNDFAWQSLTGVPDGQQGFMYGQFDNDGKMTGDEVGKKIKH